MGPLTGLLRLVSLLCCTIVIASFTMFVVNQTSSASAHQQQVLNGAPPAPTHAVPASSHVGAFHKRVDDASNALTSPFAGVVDSRSEWTTRIVKLLMALAIYGFGLGFLVRVIRVRV